MNRVNLQSYLGSWIAGCPYSQVRVQFRTGRQSNSEPGIPRYLRRNNPLAFKLSMCSSSEYNRPNPLCDSRVPRIDWMIDYYELLQISPQANSETIYRVYRYLASRFHP